MARHPDIPGIEVVIVYSDGSRATEYDASIDDLIKDEMIDSHQAKVTVAKYVEAITDHEFAIVFTIDNSYISNCDALSFQTCVDDHWIDLTFVDREDLANMPWTYTIDSTHDKKKRGRGYVWGKLRFAEIPTSKFLLRVLKHILISFSG